ncbi:MAG: hypothetical protein JST22_20105 [Bacteroidetes bacterium]|nr:hypothetical protein [Bacteroidota bacterium]
MVHMIGISIKRKVACLVILSMAAQAIGPVAAIALTGGPTQPEFSKFEPVTTTDMVNEFTGDFSYNLPVLNIPGPNGGGYALSLSYHSGEGGEEQASWVGKGWTLNPGAILRNRHGFPDDYKGQQIHHYNHTPMNWTVSVGATANAEVFSKDLGVGVNLSKSYNNYSGYKLTAGFNIDAMGILDLGYSVTNGDGSWSVSINPAAALRKVYDLTTRPDLLSPEMPEAAGMSQDGIDVYNAYLTSRHANDVAEFGSGFDHGTTGAATYGLYLAAEHVMPAYFPEYSGATYQYNVAFNVDPGLPVGLKTGFKGSFGWQKNKDEDVNAYGYMYSGNITGGGDAMDYYVEKEEAFNKRDRVLGIPFANADQFMVSGEGIGGGFRLYNRGVGQFRPASRESNNGIAQLGVDLHAGADVGIGATVSLSSHTLTMGAWTAGDQGYHFNPADQGNDAVFCRFTNDLGGNVASSQNDAAVAASAGRPYTVNSNIMPQINGGQRSGRSSYIGYSTIRQMREQPLYECYFTGGPSFFKSYNKGDSSRRFVDFNDAGIQDGIGEYAIVRPDGQRYVYGLPVYSRNECDMNYIVGGVNSSDGYLVFSPRTKDDDGYKTGERRSSPYAASYLLTQITTPDYVDRTNDGPTADDLGGWTKFNYARAAGSNIKSGNESTDWYKWRIPYYGMVYKRNSLSDPKDDIGTVAYGEKELYYLSSIETKTHIAIFVTSPRKDGYGADLDEANATAHDYATGVDPGHNKLQKLDRIELYAKNADGTIGKKLSVTHFEYDYSLCPHLPNAEENPLDAINPDSHPSGQHYRNGHLTLRRVFFEYEGAVNARTSPYVFNYDYQTSSHFSALPSAVQTKYHDIIAFRDGKSWVENPAYSPFDLDCWGNYRYQGVTRAQNFEAWTEQNPPAQYDPAAWQLKWIQLPSGGEIHIQYEEKDYHTVQNRPVMVMAKLGAMEGDPVYNGKSAHVHVNLNLLGLSTAEAIEVRKAVRRMIADPESERFYFKFLYALTGSQPNLTNCTSEFITGYTKVISANAGSGGDADLDLELPAFNTSDNIASGYDHPADAACNFVAANRAGNLDEHGVCDRLSPEASYNDQDGWDLVWNLVGKFPLPVFTRSTSCNSINLDHSYIRIPLGRDKKGGGVRVKRLLMYDKGITGDNGSAALYGTDYSYKMPDGTSSGVATNEPPSGREENPLITYFKKRDDQSWLNRILSGDDKDQFESPSGESILPAPSIGYARVVARNIHTGKTTTGYSVREFYTARDYPFDGTYAEEGESNSSVMNTALVKNDIPVIFTNGAATFRHYDMARAQGYRFVQNSMHGQLKSLSEYGGDPFGGSSSNTLITQQVFTYFQPGEKIPVVHRFGTTPSLEYLGREEEVVMEQRRVDDQTFAGGLAGDVDIVFAFIPIIIPSAFPDLDITEELLQTHVTTKIIRYPAIVKSTLTVRDGVSHLSENIGFDPESGRPVLVRTSDGYNNLTVGSSSTAHQGYYYAATIPASQQYSDLGQLAEREGLVITSNNGLAIEKRYAAGVGGERHVLNFRFTGMGVVANSIAQLVPGDLVRVLGTDNPASYLGTYYVGAVAGNQVQLLPTYISNVNTEALVSVGKVELIRSARTNQVGLDAGAVTTYGGTIPLTVDHPLP